MLMDTGTVGGLHYFNSTNGLVWIPSASNPVLSNLPDGQWDSRMYKASFVERNNVFQIWYPGWQYVSVSPDVIEEFVGYTQYPLSPSPVAGFTSDVTTGTALLTVHFTDTSINTPTNWDWYMGADETKTCDDKNPTVIFTSAGTYNIRLYASNAAGGDWENKTGYITVASAPVPPVADFFGIPTSGFVPLIVQFTDTSSGSPTEWNWSFGDGDTTNSTRQHPVHTYASAGS